MTDEEFYTHLKIGMIVWDDITCRAVSIIGLRPRDNEGKIIQLDVEGDQWRWEWEISPWEVIEGETKYGTTSEEEDDGEECQPA